MRAIFALQVTTVEQPVRVGDALERERLLHVDPEPALFDASDKTAQGGPVLRRPPGGLASKVRRLAV